MQRKAAQKASLKITEQADDDELDFVSLDEEMQQFHTVQTRGNRKALTEQENKVKPFSTVNSERPKRKASSYTDQPDSKQSLVSPNTSLDPSEDEADSASREKAKPGLSDYEKEVLKNVEERKKLFRMIVGEAKAEFMQALPSREVVAKNKLASAYNKSKDKRKVEKEFELTEPAVKSLRPRARAARHAPKEYYDESQSDFEATGEDEPFDQAIPLMSKKREVEKLPADLQDFLKPVQSLSVKEGGVATLAKSRIHSLAWHPSSSELLLAAGDFNGNIGFWKDGNSQPQCKSLVHTRAINCLSFDTSNPVRLWSSSSDGHLLCTDVESAEVSEMFSSTNPMAKQRNVTYHAQKDASTLLVSEASGAVFIIDIRTKSGAVQNSIQCFDKGANTLSLHPQDEHLFISCNRQGKTCIFDMRNTYKNEEGTAIAVVELPEMTRAVHSAFFSPLTGNYALTTNADGCLLIYDVGTKTQAKCLRNIENDAGSYGSAFKAIWHPQREDIFICGSADKQRRIELYLAPSGQVLNFFTDQQLKSACSLNVFHPTVHMFAAANSCGRVHIFRS